MYRLLMTCCILLLLSPPALAQQKKKGNGVYKIQPGDVLGIYVEGVLGNKEQPIPVHFPKKGKPTMGYPIPVWESGNISLPLIPKIKAEGRSVEELHKVLVDVYTSKKILKANQTNIHVCLMYTPGRTKQSKSSLTSFLQVGRIYTFAQGDSRIRGKVLSPPSKDWVRIQLVDNFGGSAASTFTAIIRLRNIETILGEPSINKKSGNAN